MSGIRVTQGMMACLKAALEIAAQQSKSKIPTPVGVAKTVAQTGVALAVGVAANEAAKHVPLPSTFMSEEFKNGISDSVNEKYQQLPQNIKNMLDAVTDEENIMAAVIAESMLASLAAGSKFLTNPARVPTPAMAMVGAVGGVLATAAAAAAFAAKKNGHLEGVVKSDVPTSNEITAALAGLKAGNVAAHTVTALLVSYFVEQGAKQVLQSGSDHENASNPYGFKLK